MQNEIKTFAVLYMCWSSVVVWCIKTSKSILEGNWFPARSLNSRNDFEIPTLNMTKIGKELKILETMLWAVCLTCIWQKDFWYRISPPMFSQILNSLFQTRAHFCFYHNGFKKCWTLASRDYNFVKPCSELPFSNFYLSIYLRCQKFSNFQH